MPAAVYSGRPLLYYIVHWGTNLAIMYCSPNGELHKYHAIKCFGIAGQVYQVAAVAQAV